MKSILKQYIDLQVEIKELEKRIDKLSNLQVQHDKVRGSDDKFPYTQKSFYLEGYNIQDLDRLAEIREILADRMIRCEDIKVEIERFISEIPDSRTRRVFQYRYINGLEWLPISRRLGAYDESYARKIHDRYLEGLG